MRIRATIQGIQEAQQANLRAVAAFGKGGAFDALLADIVRGLHRYAVGITHVDTGALRASHRMRLERRRRRGMIYIDPDAINPRGQRPAVYGPVEEKRGGSHAFYRRTVDEAAGRVVTSALRRFRRGLWG